MEKFLTQSNVLNYLEAKYVDKKRGDLKTFFLCKSKCVLGMPGKREIKLSLQIIFFTLVASVY